MATGIGLVSVTQIQKLSKSQQQQHHQNQSNPNSTTSTASPTWMWNPRNQQQDQEDDSWEVRAFAEDTNNIMGTTWPPRSYTCTFCRREFRSAQALGGHMNVHRRDRARLRQASPHNHPISSLPHPSPSFFSHSQDLIANGGLCLLYPFSSPNSVPFSNTLSHNTGWNNACGDSPSAFFPVSSHSHSHPPNNFMRTPTCSTSTSFDLSVAQPASGMNGFSPYSLGLCKVEQEPASSSTINHGHHEELDLELRLGNKST